MKVSQNRGCQDRAGDVRAFLSESISIRDTAVRKEKKENFYHGIFLGLLRAEGSWIVKSNAESGTGYSDILLIVPREKTGCVIEVKYAENGALTPRSERRWSRLKPMSTLIC